MERAWLLFNRVNCEIRLWKRAKVPSARMGIALNMLMEIVEPWQDSLLCGEIIPPPRIEVNRLLKAFDEVKVTIGREDIWLRSILGDIIGDYQSYCAILEQERVVREEIERRMKEKKEEPDEDEDEEEEEVGSDLSSHSFKEKEEIIMPSRTHECVTIVDSDEEEEEGEDEDDEEEARGVLALAHRTEEGRQRRGRGERSERRSTSTQKYNDWNTNRWIK